MSDVAPEVPANPVDGAETEVSEEPVEIEEQVPEEITRLLEEPEFEDEEEFDLTPVAQEESYFEDEDVDAIKRKLAKSEKRRQWLEEKQQAEALKKARKDAEKFFKYADLDSITATSRRGFLKEAKAQHDRIKAKVEAATEAERKELAEAKARLEQEGLADRRAQWGHAPLGDEESARRHAERTQQVYAELANRDGFGNRVAARMADPNDPVGQAFSGMLGGIETRD